MRVKPQVLAAVAVLPLALAGCGLLGQVKPGPPPEDTAAKARERVQLYLDAMTAKDVAAGRAQLCPVLHASFDQAATGPNGDFAKHFTVRQAVITGIRPDGGAQQVSAAITVVGPARPAPINILFTVTKVGDQWCIADEAPGGDPASPAPGGAPTPSP